MEEEQTNDGDNQRETTSSTPRTPRKTRPQGMELRSPNPTSPEIHCALNTERSADHEPITHTPSPACTEYSAHDAARTGQSFYGHLQPLAACLYGIF